MTAVRILEAVGLGSENVVSNRAFSPVFLLSFHSEVMALLPGCRLDRDTGGDRDSGQDMLGCEISSFTTLSNPVKK